MTERLVEPATWLGERTGTPVVPWEADDLDRSVMDRIRRVAAAVPDNLALADADRRLTYRELVDDVDRIARGVVAQLGPDPEPVVVVGEQSAETVLAIFAVLAAGKAYVPVDPNTPARRTAATIAASETRLLLATPGMAAERARREWAAEVPVMDLDEARRSDGEALPSVDADELLNITFTSGSTGEPKGVMQIQRNILALLHNDSGKYPIIQEDRIGLVVPVTFGASASDFFAAAFTGASVHIFDLKIRGVEEMARWIADQQITMTHMVPTVFRKWMDQLPDDYVYPHMRLVKLGGEAVLRRDFEGFRRHFTDGCVLRSSLATTESFSICAWPMRRSDVVVDDVVPVGWVVPHKKVEILDEDGIPLPRGEEGQIAVTSRYLSSGYWRLPEVTAARFLPDPTGGPEITWLTGDLGRYRPDGMLEHLGRMDDMIKVRGQRVEPGAVQTVLLDQPSVGEAVAVGQEMPDGGMRLVAFVVPAPGHDFDAAELRTAVSDRLPMHMVPSVFVELDAFPSLPFGKVNKLALPMPQVGSGPAAEFVAPRSETETAVARAVADMLGTERVGIHDNLFELGLDSLNATRIVGRIYETFGLEPPLDMLFERPTVAEIAAWVDEAAAADPLAALLDEIEQLSEDDVARLLAEDAGGA